MKTYNLGKGRDREKERVGHVQGTGSPNYSKIMRYILQAVTRIFNLSLIIYKIQMFTPNLNLSITVD